MSVKRKGTFFLFLLAFFCSFLSAIFTYPWLWSVGALAGEIG